MLARSRSKSLKLSFLLGCLCAAHVLAQDGGDPPTRVARLNMMQGAISMEPAGANEWVPGIINRPFTTGDFLFADAGSRAELHLDTAVIRMNEQTSFGFLNLADQVAQLQLSEGEMQVHVRRLGDDDVFEVDTPNAAISLLRNGDYAFTVDPNNGTTFLVVRHGQAEITGGGQAFSLAANQSVMLSGTDQLSFDVENAPDPDDFESFCLERDRREAHLQATRYVPADMIGYEDLDGNGHWRTSADYGPVWYPNAVPAGWAPYQNGHWAWIDPWGWTWVDDMPWGFAPFHYGRWAYVGGAWGWTPGPIAVVAVGRPVVRPVYAPALVAFIGGVTIAIGGGGPRMGWVPLGPGELYSPAYYVSPGYYNHVNVSNTVISRNVNITNVYNTTYVNKTVINNTTIVNNNQTYVNMRAPNAVMTMPQSAFASGQTANRVGAPVPAQAAARIQMSSAAVLAPPVAPTKQALTAGYSGAQNSVPHPPAQLMSRPVVAKVAPPPAPVPFAAQQQVLQRNAGQVFNAQTVRTSVPATAIRPTAPVKIANQGQTVTKTNVVVGQKVGPAVAAPNARPTNPANLHGVPPNRLPANQQPNVNAGVPQPAAKTPQPPPSVQAYKPPPSPEKTTKPPAQVETYKPPPPEKTAPPARVGERQEPPHQPAAQSQKPTKKPTTKPKEEKEKKTTEH
jgi:FecR protein